jgi:hypothetical protein
MLIGDGFSRYGLNPGLEKILEIVDPCREKANGQKHRLKGHLVKGEASGQQERWILTLALTSIC